MSNETTIVQCRECIFFCPEDAYDRCINHNGLFNPVEYCFCSYGQEREQPTNSTPLNQEERWLKTV
jgi:hypothetical protein|nr:MAG TPA: 4Fe-4S dicluster domain protein [Caudoviricetes sp.]